MINQEKNFLKFQRSENNSRTGTEIVTKIFFFMSKFCAFLYSFPEKCYTSNHIYEKARYPVCVGRVSTSPTNKIDFLVGRSVVRFLRQLSCRWGSAQLRFFEKALSSAISDGNSFQGSKSLHGFLTLTQLS